MRVEILCLIVLGALTGCVVGPDYVPPKEPAPAHWAEPLADGEADTRADLTTWWTSFKDPELDELMAAAAQANLSVRTAEARVREARAQRDVAAGARLPSVGASVAYSRNHFSENTFPPLPPDTALTYNLYSAGFDAAWELDLFGGIRRAVQASSAELDAAEYAQRDVLISVLAEVARSYIDARAYQQRLAITQENITAEQDTLELTRSLNRGGLTSDLDVEQATALLNATQAEVPALQAGFAQSVHQLAVLLGQTPGSLLASMSEPKSIPLNPPVVPVGLPSELLRRRPDVQRAERELAASTAQIGVARSELFPNLSLTGLIGVVSTAPGNWFEYASRSVSIGPTLQWNLFEGGRLRANVRVQEARASEALDSYQQVVLVALEDAENALVAYAKEQTRRQSLRRSEAASRASFDLSSQLYRNGLVDFLNVLVNERALYASQEALIESTQSVSLDLVQLYKALGGGWEQASAVPAAAPALSQR